MAVSVEEYRRGPFMRVEWNDPESGARGWVVVDRLVGGIATGGTRMRKGCTEGEVGDLARGMSYKTGVLKLPVGGAKGGLDFDPHDPRAREVLGRFVKAMRPLLESYWVTAEDLGVPQPLLDSVFDEAGLGMSLYAALRRSENPGQTLSRVREAFAVEVEGIALPDVIGGYGVAEAAKTAIESLGWPEGRARAVVQGFGSMGGSTARYLDRTGVKVVGVVDAKGAIANPDGLDVESLLAARTEYGEINRAALRSEDEELPREEWLSIEAEVLVPAAVSYAITPENCGRVNAEIIVEAANVPTTPEAEAKLLERNIPVIPDFIANAGAVGWAWWTLFGDITAEPEEAFDKLSEEMRRAVGEIMAAWKAGEGSPREAARRISQKNLDEFALEYGETSQTRNIL
ncbi:MAG: Glu/Leu/Phe/Val dehydrogenase dimerization domain-containing protein [Rubrobacteraceae bacterium]